MGGHGLDDLFRSVDKWQALMDRVMNIGVLYSTGNFMTIWGTVSFSKRTPLQGVSTHFLKIIAQYA